MRCLAGSDAVLVCDPAVVGSAMSSVDFIERNGYGKIPVEMHGAAASEKN
jgi:cobalt/nickel transport system ATP-binding protein